MASTSKVIKLPRRYDYIIVGVENGKWVERPHRGSIETIPKGMCWKARRVADEVAA